jgi:hypothetical protein
MSQTLAIMQQTISAFKKLNSLFNSAPLANDWECFNVSDFVAKYGKSFEYQQLPVKYPKMTPKYCFYNSMCLALKRRNLVYVEGFALVESALLPIHHAWCVEIGSNKVIDPTTSNLRDYFGVPFKIEVVDKKSKDKTGQCSIIDDVEHKWPLLKMSREQVLKLVDDTV